MDQTGQPQLEGQGSEEPDDESPHEPKVVPTVLATLHNPLARLPLKWDPETDEK
jgi:hypothetical protein